jgi:hypothetical protein
MLKKDRKKTIRRRVGLLAIIAILLFAIIAIIAYTNQAQPTDSSTIAPTLTPPAVLNYNFGMSLGTTLLGLSPSQLSAELDDLEALHIGWVRMDFDWSIIQPQNNITYNWNDYDRVVAALDARDIKILAILDYSTPWAVSTDCGSVRCPPLNDSDFAAYASAVASRYAPMGVHDWEIWNEPNLGGSWLPRASASGYVNLLKAAYPALHAADSAAFVVVGGLAPTYNDRHDIAPISFLSQMYALGAKNYFDAVGFHPYSYPYQPSYFASWNAWSQMSLTSPSIRSVMTANGDSGKQIWITEFGAPTAGNDGSYVSEAKQTAIISQAITLKEGYQWTGPLFIYSYKDLSTDTSTTQNFFGIIRYDGSKKPAYIALQQLLAATSS